MIINPIIPIWVMIILSVLFLVLKRKGTANYIRQIFIVILLFVINLRIMVPGNDVPTVMPKVDVLFVIDNTISMLAEDYEDKKTRMDAVKEDCKYITEQFPGASFCVVTFNDGVQRLTPYTVDKNMVLDTIKVLRGQTRYHAQGTSLNDAMEGIEQILKDDRENHKILFFISDGEVVNSEKLKSYSQLSAYVDGGAVLGYGTKEGGAMKVLDYLGDEAESEYLYYYDENYDEQLAISKIDEDNLKSIAGDFGIDYVHMTNQCEIDSTIKKIQDIINNLEIAEDMESKEGYEDIYYFFVIPLVVLLIVDFVYYRKKI